MALLFNSNIKILFTGAILRSLGNANASQFSPFNLGFTIYGGAIPTPAAIEASWSSYNSGTANFLVHYNSASWSQPAQGNLIQLSVPSAVTPTNSGTATWAIIWGGIPTGPQLASATLPLANFLVVGVTDSVGDGVIRFASTSISTSTPVAPVDGSIGINLP